MSDTVTIQLDGQAVTCVKGETIIEAADRHGVYIPRYCYHKHLSVVANCRMCLVEVEGAPKTLPACATPVSPDMKVHTTSPKARVSQQAVMEFLLVNHPLDCPICDQGGECELQDYAMAYGEGVSHFKENKRTLVEEDLGPLIAPFMRRCIYCTRCVRFSEEIAGMPELGGMGRGGSTQIGTYLATTVGSELSGNMIDLCPVGALTSKPFKYTGRSWSFQERPSIAPHDALGSHIYTHILPKQTDKEAQLMRVLPRYEASLNESWLSDRDRFSYEGATVDRLHQPKIKTEGRWQTVTWEKALDVVMHQLHTMQKNPSQTHVLCSAQATTEEAYLLQAMMRRLGIHRLQSQHKRLQTSASTQALSPMGSLRDFNPLDESDCILVFGGFVRHDMPLLNHRLRQAQAKGVPVHVVSAYTPSSNFPCVTEQVAPQDWLSWIKDSVAQDSTQGGIKKALREAKSPVVIVGSDAWHHPQSDQILHAIRAYCEAYQGKYTVISDGPNASGVWAAGCVSRSPLLADDQTIEPLSQSCDYYWLHGLELADFANPQAIRSELTQAKQVIAVTAFESPELRDVADVMLPMALSYETSGTWMNMLGETQSFEGSLEPPGEARPAWKIYRVLAHALHGEDFAYHSSAEVLNAFKQAWQNRPPAQASSAVTSAPTTSDALWRLGQWGMMQTDPLVRRAVSLQTAWPNSTKVRIHPDTAKAYQLVAGDMVTITQGAQQVSVLWEADTQVAKGCVVTNATSAEFLQLGPVQGSIEIARRPS